MMNPKLKELRAKAMALPLQPGVYIMKNAQGEIIYIGKAKKLKNRVSQYFGSQNNHTEKVRRMVDNVDDFEYIITDSEGAGSAMSCKRRMTARGISGRINRATMSSRRSRKRTRSSVCRPVTAVFPRISGAIVRA